MNTCTFSWPPRECSPNWRGHWAAKAKAAKAYRKECWVLALSAGLKAEKHATVYVSITFHPPSRRRYDLDNCVGSLKNGLDGLADALGVNDYQFRINASLAGSEPSGRVFVRISDNAPEAA